MPLELCVIKTRGAALTNRLVDKSIPARTDVNVSKGAILPPMESFALGQSSLSSRFFAKRTASF